MAEAIRNEVVALRRVGFGSLRLGQLAEGEARRLRARGGAALEGCRVPVSDFVAKAAGKAAEPPPGYD